MRGPTLFKELRKDYSFAYLSAVWLLFGENPIEIIIDKLFLLDFAQIVTKQQILNIVSFTNFLHSW